MTLNEDVFPIENGDIPASYVSLPEGSPGNLEVLLSFAKAWLPVLRLFLPGLYFGPSVANSMVERDVLHASTRPSRVPTAGKTGENWLNS